MLVPEVKPDEAVVGGGFGVVEGGEEVPGGGDGEEEEDAGDGAEFSRVAEGAGEEEEEEGGGGEEDEGYEALGEDGEGEGGPEEVGVEGAGVGDVGGALRGCGVGPTHHDGTVMNGARSWVEESCPEGLKPGLWDGTDPTAEAVSLRGRESRTPGTDVGLPSQVSEARPGAPGSVLGRTGYFLRPR